MHCINRHFEILFLKKVTLFPAIFEFMDNGTTYMKCVFRGGLDLYFVEI